MINYNRHNQDARDYYEEHYSEQQYDISVHCRNYKPRGRSNVLNMENYSTCDNCCHLRADNRCGIMQQTLS